MSCWPELGPMATSCCRRIWESKFSSSVEGYRHRRGDWEWLLDFSQPAVTAISIRMGRNINLIRAFMDVRNRIATQIRKIFKNLFVPLTKNIQRCQQIFRSGCIQVLSDVIRDLSFSVSQLCFLHVRVILGRVLSCGGKITVCSSSLTFYQLDTSPPLPKRNSLMQYFGSESQGCLSLAWF